MKKKYIVLDFFLLDCECLLPYLSVPQNSSNPQLQKNTKKYELEVLDAILRLSADPFNRRLSETNLLDLKIGKNCQNFGGQNCQPQSSIDHLTTMHLLTTSTKAAFCLEADNDNLYKYTYEDNPFQNDKLPLWEGQQGGGSSGSNNNLGQLQKRKINSSNLSSPENNNYGGHQVAYGNPSLNETPSSPDLVNHRQMNASPPGTPEGNAPKSPEIIQVTILNIRPTHGV